jgi:hypothetical protein
MIQARAEPLSERRAIHPRSTRKWFDRDAFTRNARTDREGSISVAQCGQCIAASLRVQNKTQPRSIVRYNGVPVPPGFGGATSMRERMRPAEHRLDEPGARVAPRVEIVDNLVDVERDAPFLDAGVCISGFDQHPRRTNTAAR